MKENYPSMAAATAEVLYLYESLALIFLPHFVTCSHVSEGHTIFHKAPDRRRMSLNITLGTENRIDSDTVCLIAIRYLPEIHLEHLQHAVTPACASP